MDLRERPSKEKRFAEWVIRFRIPALILLLAGWWFGSASWHESVAAALTAGHHNTTWIRSFIETGFGNHWSNGFAFLRPALAILLLLLLRAKLSSVKSALMTLAFLIAVMAGCWTLDGTAQILPAILGASLVILVTTFFFGRNAWFIAGLPYALCIFMLASWIPGIVRGLGMGWQITLALASADLATMIFSIRTSMRNSHIKAGAIVIAQQEILPAVLSSGLVLFLADVVNHILFAPNLQGGSLWGSAGASLGYLVITLVIAPILFSLSPFDRIRIKGRTMAMPITSV